MKANEQLQAVRDWQLPEKFLFYPAQFWAHKNHLRLIEAFREVAAEVPDLAAGSHRKKTGPI